VPLEGHQLAMIAPARAAAGNLPGARLARLGPRHRRRVPARPAAGHGGERQPVRGRPGRPRRARPLLDRRHLRPQRPRRVHQPVRLPPAPLLLTPD